MAMGQKSKATIARKIVAREPFKALKGNMHGGWYNNAYDSPSFGWLTNFPAGRATKAEIQALLEDRDVYIVYSYGTPIAYAWDRNVVVPDHKYSVTTTSHQTVARSPQFYAEMLNADGTWARN